MHSLITLIDLIAVVAVVYVIAPVVADTYRRFHGTKVVQCPDGNVTTEIEVDAVRAAGTSAWGQPALQITRCSRRSERHYCDEACLEQLR